ncbi:general substrate transporter [Anaeromyces robustus]|uniref:General substrate transporter n=1 Tax=Anaeromyces robustus TaxID=1754192 RepID=A0A1Y1X078_9FUNG|nr:general substrate transporter [Anaeromyces robustus]|eukprot:ORX79045.1 general substrate transporter [Anaeromyces robustus]
MSKLDYINKHLFFYSLICGIGAIIYGWEVGIASFGEKFGLYRFEKGSGYVATDDKNIREMIITPSFTVGGMVGSLLVLWITDSLGRSKSLRISAVVYFIGAAFQILGGKIIYLCIGRFIAGIASGIASTLCPLYLAEISPKEIRGSLGIINAIGLQLGMCFASLYDTLCLKLITKNMEAQWRVALAGLAIPSIIFLLIVWFLPETPRYLLMKNKNDQALKVLANIREKNTDDPSVSNEFNEMSNRLKVELLDGIVTWKEAINTKSILYRLIIVSVLQLLHMLVGVNAIGYYSTQIYSEYLNLSLPKYGAWLATLNNFASFFLTLPAMRYIENIGRKPILKWGAFALGCCMVGIYFKCLLFARTKDKIYGWICVIFIYAFTVIYGWSWSSVVFVWQAEVFPLRMRTKANAVGTFFQYVGSMFVTATTTTLMKYLSYNTFLIYAGFCFIAYIFATLCIRETKGLALEEMERLYGGDSVPSKEEIKVNRNIKEKTGNDIISA